MHKIVAALAFFACSETEPAAPCPGARSAEPGSAVYTDPESFVPLSDGDTVWLVFGGQGGFHVWHSLRAGGVERAATVVRHVERVADGLVLFDNAPGDRLDLVADDDACRLEYAQPSFVSNTDARDQDVFLEASVDDGSGPVTGRVRVHVVCPPPGTDDGSGNDVAEFCASDKF